MLKILSYICRYSKIVLGGDSIQLNPVGNSNHLVALHQRKGILIPIYFNLQAVTIVRIAVKLHQNL